MFYLEINIEILQFVFLYLKNHSRNYLKIKVIFIWLNPWLCGNKKYEKMHFHYKFIPKINFNLS